MKITKSQLKRIIKEELESVMIELKLDSDTPQLSMDPRLTTDLNVPKAQPSKGPYNAADMTRHRREAALFWDLEKWDERGGKGKFKPRNLGSGYTEQHAEKANASYAKTPAHKRARHGTIGTESDQGAAGGVYVGLDKSMERYFDPSMGPISNLRTGLSQAQRNVLFDRLARSGAWKYLRIDDPIRADYRKWIKTRLGRGRK